jgi:hypothetical protein
MQLERNMQPPFVSPAESLVIGLCAGEYLDHDLVGMACGMSFIGFLERRLGSFFPALRRHRIQAAERPETIVWASGPIKALAKRIWPDHFDRNQSREFLGAVLHNHLDSPNAAESRFASIPLTLYRTYRNTAQHHFAGFTCTLNEARLFVQGVRVLVELAAAIKGQ